MKQSKAPRSPRPLQPHRAAANFLRLGLLGTLVASAHAEERPTPVVVVTASAAEVDLRDAPASISVISREEIERQPVYDLATLLRRIPGISGGYSPNGDQSKIKLRGLPENYTLILVDGKRMGGSGDTNYRPDLGRQDLNWISPEMIERIEVVRGPMSTLYGSEAMGGVINIITRKIRRQWGGSVGANFTRPQDSDRGEATQLLFNLAGPLAQDIGLRLSGSATRQSPDETTDGFVAGGRATPNGVGGSRDENVSALFTWRPAAGHSLSLDLGKGKQRSTQSAAQNASGNAALIPAWGASRLTRDSVGLGYEGRWGETDAKFDLYRSKYTNEESFGAAESIDTTFDARLNRDVTLAGMPHRLAFGGQWRRSELENAQTIGTVPIDYLGQPVSGSRLAKNGSALFAEDQWQFTERMSLTLGARLDHDAKYGNHTSPRAYLVYRPTGAWTVKGGVARGFRAPTLKESSPGAATQSRGGGCAGLAPLGWTSASGGCYMAGNAALQPETSTNAEVGVNYQAKGRDLGLTYFHTDFKNKIEYEPLGFFNGYWWTRMQNLDKARTRGVEGTARLPLGADITWRNNLTYMIEARNTSTGASLLSTPKISGYSALGWQIGRALYAELSAQYTGKQLHGSQSAGLTFAKAYTVTDLTFNYTVNRTLTLRAGVNNLLEEGPRADGKTDYYVPTRRFFLGFTSRY